MFRAGKDFFLVSTQSSPESQSYDRTPNITQHTGKSQESRHGYKCTFVGCSQVFRRKKDMKVHQQSHLKPVPDSLKQFVAEKATSKGSSSVKVQSPDASVSVPAVRVVMRLIPGSHSVDEGPATPSTCMTSTNISTTYSSLPQYIQATPDCVSAVNNAASSLLIGQTFTPPGKIANPKPDITHSEVEKFVDGLPEAIVTQRVGSHMVTHVLDSNQQRKTLLLDTPTGCDDVEVSCARTDRSRNLELSEKAKRRQKLSKFSLDSFKGDEPNEHRRTLKRSTSNPHDDDDSVLRISLRHTSRSRKLESTGAARTLPRTLQPNEDNARRLQLNIRASRAVKRPRARSLSPTDQRARSKLSGQQMEHSLSSTTDEYFEQVQLQTGWLARSHYSPLLCIDAPRSTSTSSVNDYSIDV